MASPYLPTAQFLFAGLTRWLPLRPIVFQIAMVIFELLTGLLIIRLLNVARLPAYRILIYLWNPLVIVEVAHGAHVDAWMIFLTMLSVWLTFSPNRMKLSTWLAPVTLALATLTKFMPVLLLPILFWRWRWPQLALYGLVTLALLVPFGLQAGWGLTGPLDGTGLFGAARIYADQWNFNSGLFHWLEVKYLPLLGVTDTFESAKRIVLAIMLVALAVVWLQARHRPDMRSTLRLMAVPFMVYLLLTATVHPWYALMLLVFVPFLPPAADESPWRWLAVAPWLYLSAALPLSYLTYLNPLDFRELEWVRRAEWLPTLALLLVWIIYQQGSLTGRHKINASLNPAPCLPDDLFGQGLGSGGNFRHGLVFRQIAGYILVVVQVGGGADRFRQVLKTMDHAQQAGGGGGVVVGIPAGQSRRWSWSSSDRPCRKAGP